MSATRITVIEDNARILNALKLALTREGYAVTGIQHAESIDTLNADLLIIDFLLEETTAIELLRDLSMRGAVAKNIHDIPVIVISAYPSSKLELHNTGFNIVGFLPKPFDLKDLFGLIDETSLRV